jgi:NAD(P)-dependent dehydrogenase (short-subunit alcohol dehydrogenase family)
MNLKLADKRALVSGSTKGIGLAIATALEREGARVIINGRTEASISAALSEILGSVPNAKIESFVGDLATPQAAELLGAKFPAMDILVNNLGIFEPKPFEQIPDDDWRRSHRPPWDVHLWGARRSRDALQLQHTHLNNVR